MITLEPFTTDDFDRLIAWIKSEEELIRFAGPLFKYPLTHDQLDDYLAQTKKQPYRIKLNQTQQIIGHCELNFENEMPRVSRILIGESSLRNQGIGQQVVRAMIEIIFNTTDHEAIDLSVFDDNLNAIACYRKIGFRIRPGFETSMLVAGNSWNALNMLLEKYDYQQAT